VHADTLSGRIFITLTALLLLFLGAAAAVGELRLRSVLGNNAETRLAAACEILMGPAEDALLGRLDREALTLRLRDLGAIEKMRLTVIDAKGFVIADSEAEGALANHAERPEVIESLKNGVGHAERRSTTTGKLSRYWARTLKSGSKVLGTVRAATEGPETDAAVSSLRESLVWFGVTALVVGLASVLFMARRLARPLEEIERNAAALAAGDLEGHIRAEGPLEVRRLAETLNSMSRELGARLESTRRARTEIETILASMAEGVVAVDAKERVLLMNQAAAELLGLPAPLAAGAALWENLRFPDLERALRAVLAGQGPWSGDAASPQGGGRMLGLSVAPVSIHEERGAVKFSGAVALLSDVTAIRRLEQVRIDFVANVSHELRTPLAAVMGALETLADPEQDQESRARFLDIANRNAARLQAIVSDLLDLSSIEAEGDRMPLELIRIDGPLRTAASALIGAAESKGVRLELPPQLPGPVLVHGNTQRLEQVFTNLLENAIKYTPKGGQVVARVRISGREVHVDVQDSGIGIPPSSLPRVFERFYRVDHSRSRDMGGTGLGLAIVKHVMRAHGGQVSVKSEEGSGSTFTVSLPRWMESGRS
jgi:two-component system, OmpR family, phosphate regulon sensor histidine kinase PhoR